MLPSSPWLNKMHCKSTSQSGCPATHRWHKGGFRPLLLCRLVARPGLSLLAALLRAHLDVGSTLAGRASDLLGNHLTVSHGVCTPPRAHQRQGACFSTWMSTLGISTWTDRQTEYTYTYMGWGLPVPWASRGLHRKDFELGTLATVWALVTAGEKRQRQEERRRGTSWAGRDWKGCWERALSTLSSRTQRPPGRRREPWATSGCSRGPQGLPKRHLKETLPLRGRRLRCVDRRHTESVCHALDVHTGWLVHSWQLWGVSIFSPLPGPSELK